MVEDGRIENVYRLQIMNATEQPQRYSHRRRRPARPGGRSAAPRSRSVRPQARWVPVRVQLPPQAAAGADRASHPIHFDIERIEAPGQPARTVHEKSTFLVPR